ncbi:hypothetical protein AKO1_009819 [Acrasis kona]|uniref:Uncharacterized protein n=1 Tax=Acrasis kona TaxID=1008807 RepID=A0AAW2ZQ75_9EUKA
MNEETRKYIEAAKRPFGFREYSTLYGQRIFEDLIGKRRFFSPELSKLSLLAEVFQHFANTNESNMKKCTIKEILAYKDGAPQYHRYYHHNIPYLATVFLFRSFRHAVNIKLNNNGFQYVPMNREKMPPRHDCDGWILLEEDDKKDLLPILTILNTASSGAYRFGSCFYNYDESRLDVKFVSTKSEYKNVVVTFENGYPWYDDEEEFN